MLAACLRIPRLADRPMHADEAVLADKFGTLLETGIWKYDPMDYHGPVLPYATLAAAWVAGQHRYVDLTESTLRAIPVAFGLALVAMPLLLVRGLGIAAAASAAGLTAISPAMVYYSRYYIPETILVCLTAGLIGAGFRYAETRKPGWAVLGGVLLVLMFATKETAVVAAGCMVLAVVLLRFGERRAEARRRGRLLAMFFIPEVVARAAGMRGHVAGPEYYLGFLAKTEAPICLLALVGAYWGWERPLVRFLAVFTGLMAVTYSLIPYKTPWCLLGFLHGAILLAGVGLAGMWRSHRVVATALVALSLVFLVRASPYDYTPTSPDVLKVVAAIPDADSRIQIASRDNLWPLPWYLRRFPHLEWWREISNEMKPADVILVSPALEPALIHQLYEVPPPGERPLYGNLFDGDAEVRAGVRLRGYYRVARQGSY